MDSLSVDITVPLRAFRLELALETGGETFALAGPSGAGKTTLLRTIAGLTSPARGTIRCGGDTWFDAAQSIDVRPEERAVGFVFQEYALFPHMTVEQNVRFAGADTSLLERFEIGHLARARPGDLSGGERQRVALVRALARRPKVLLMDEPLGALDAQTRGHVRGELKLLLSELDLPTVLVTHDYADAAALAGRVGVLVDGRIVQTGTPEELVARPADAFVADFTGANFLLGRAEARAGGLTDVTLDDGTVLVSTDVARGRVGVVVHPWEVTVARDAPADSSLNHIRGRIASIVTLGNRARVRVGPLTAEVTGASVDRLGLVEGDVAVASFKATGTRLVPLD